MIDKKLLDFIKENQRFRKNLDYYTKYFILIFPIALLFLGISSIYIVLKSQNNELLLIGLIFLVISVPFFFFTIRRLSDILKFEVVFKDKTKISLNDLYNRIQDNFQLRNIKIDNNKNIIIAFTKWSAFSWGEEITIILDNDKILINSRPTGTRQPVTIYKDKQNIKIIIDIIKNPAANRR